MDPSANTDTEAPAAGKNDAPEYIGNEDSVVEVPTTEVERADIVFQNAAT